LDILGAAAMVMAAQKRAAALLGRLASAGRLPHALIFTGPEGAGKELAAVDLIARVNCTAPDGDPWRKCSSCNKIRTLEHPDLHLVFPVPSGDWRASVPVVVESRREDFFNYGEFGARTRSIGINWVREVLVAVSKQPFEGARAGVVFFEAHLATTEAQNALLKLLEEPPASSLIVLVTEHPDRLLPTIRSRCQQVRFDRLPPDTVASFLATYYAVEEQESRRIAAGADGNIRRGIKLLDERFLGLRDDAAAVLRLVIDGKGRELLDESQAISFRYGREEIAALFDEAIALLLQVMRLQDESDARGADLLNRALGDGRLDKARRRDIPADIGRIRRASGDLARNANTELTVSHLLLDLAGKWC
jgi:DNA polymerase-3 subunit delta'